MTATAVGLDVEGTLGYSFIIADHLSISLGVGAGYRVLSVATESSLGTTDGQLWRGLSLTGRLAVGYAF